MKLKIEDIREKQAKIYTFSEASVTVEGTSYQDFPKKFFFTLLNGKDFDDSSIHHHFLIKVYAYLKKEGFEQFEIFYVHGSCSAISELLPYDGFRPFPYITPYAYVKAEGNTFRLSLYDENHLRRHQLLLARASEETLAKWGFDKEKVKDRAYFKQELQRQHLHNSLVAEYRGTLQIVTDYLNGRVQIPVFNMDDLKEFTSTLLLTVLQIYAVKHRTWDMKIEILPESSHLEKVITDLGGKKMGTISYASEGLFIERKVDVFELKLSPITFKDEILSAAKSKSILRSLLIKAKSVWDMDESTALKSVIELVQDQKIILNKEVAEESEYSLVELEPQKIKLEKLKECSCLYLDQK